MRQRSLAKRLWYSLLRTICRLLAITVFQMRSLGREHLPAQGGALLLSNHQSHLDPVIIGLCSNRRLNYLARLSLFRFAPFRWLIESLDAIPIDREGSGFGGLKETLKRLKAEEMVLIFPEGTRTSSGEVQPLKPGFCAIARRAGVPLVPLAVEGAFHAWPRNQLLPNWSPIHLAFGRPIQPSDLAHWNDQELVAHVQERIAECHAMAARSRSRLG